MEQQQSFEPLSQYDRELFAAGVHYRLYEKMGAHVCQQQGRSGVYFSVWAPNARYVSVVCDYNYWNAQSHPLQQNDGFSGIWEGFIADISAAERYKFHIEGHNGYSVQKADPFAFAAEAPPATASVVSENKAFSWNDHSWLEQRTATKMRRQPLSIYELHVGSWRRGAENEILSYRDLAQQLPAYCKEMGFTHVELLPIAEHPFYGSWGYQITGYYAASSRYGSAADFAYLIDCLHQAGIGVILDWVPAHFPTDEHGLGFFDGTHLYEHADPRKGFHPDWKSYIFNLSRNEVRAFLISNALYWLDRFHIDGLRVDAVASMLYLDYSRTEGNWIPNEYGGRENLEAIEFLRAFNEAVHSSYPGVLTFAEESTSWPGVTHPVQTGGLGFDYKWMMGWMHDTLRYFSTDPIHRKYHHDLLPFSMFYAYSERFVLPLSHDEVVHGKRSLLEKMPGDRWQQFANLRLLLAYLFAHPGGKLLFMGAEFGQSHEWRHDYSLDWHEAEGYLNSGLSALVADLNRLNQHTAMDQNNEREGFAWLDFADRDNSVLCWQRIGSNGDRLTFVFNGTPVIRYNYRVGIPNSGFYDEILNTDDTNYAGSGISNPLLETAPIARHGHRHSLSLVLPPLALIVLQRQSANHPFND